MSIHRAFSSFQTLFESGAIGALPDRQLLDRFARLGDREAAETLVGRHGPMVMGVCRRILGNGSDADDAFQATFLVLIRRARSLRGDVVLAAWLHGVASKVAIRARSDRACRASRERTDLAVERAVERDPADFALKAVLDEEVARLPWKYRVPVALCYLEGLTHEEAAHRLDWPIGSVKGRLARAKALLGSRLARRGVTAGVAAAAVDGLAEAAVSDVSRRALIRAAERIAWGGSWKSVVSDRVVRMTGEVLTSMLITKLKTAAFLAAAVGLTATGVGFAAREGDSKPSDAPTPSTPVARAETSDEAPREVVPPGLAREPQSPEDQYLDAARRAYRTLRQDGTSNSDGLDAFYRASRRILDAQQAVAKTEEARKTALAEHRDRLKDLLREADQAGGSEAPIQVAEARAMLAEAELWRSRGGEAPREADDSKPGDGGSGLSEGEQNPRSKAILKMLEEPVTMNFPNETPLEDVLKFIKAATNPPQDGGLAIYVDPIELNQADKTMTSPVSLDLEGVPLRRTLQLLLDQIGLAYFVEDGMIVIHRAGQESYGLKPSMAQSSPLQKEVDRARRGELSVTEMNALLEKMKLIQQVVDVQKALANDGK